MGITLPESIYSRLSDTAQTLSMSQEDVIEQSMALLMPALESDLSDRMQQKFNQLMLLSDLALWKVAHSTMSEQRQNALEHLAEQQKHRPLTDVEQADLRTLMAEAEAIMLQKAEAFRLLALRGHTVFATSWAIPEFKLPSRRALSSGKGSHSSGMTRVLLTPSRKIQWILIF